MKTKAKIYWTIALLVGVGLLYYVISLSVHNTQDCQTTPATEMDIGSHSNLALHIHQQLSITINGEAVDIPANIGIETDIMRPIHTHDASGKIHVEGTCERDFTLQELFAVWGKTFNSSCIMDSCVDDTHTLKMYVNGVESLQYETLVLKDEDSIEIVYEEI